MNQYKNKIIVFLVLSLYTNIVNAQNIFGKEKYDSVYFVANNFIIAKKQKAIFLFNVKGDIYLLNKFITLAEIQKDVAYQIVLGEKLKMINVDGRFDDSLKVNFQMRVCGTVESYKNSIFIKNDSTFISFHTIYPEIDINSKNYDKHVETYDTIFIQKKLEIYFFNNARNFNYKGNIFFNNSLTPDLYFEKTPINKTHILSIKLQDSVVKKTYLVKDIDSVFQSSYTFPNATFQPFIFRKKKLLGYYPMQTTAKYKSIISFNRHFAAFTLPNGQRGWLDINGKEYFY